MNSVEWTSGLVGTEYIHPQKKQVLLSRPGRETAPSLYSVQMGPLKMQEIIDINMATDRVNPPQKDRFHIGRETWYPPQYGATIVKEQDLSKKGNTALVLLPGITVSGTQFAHIAESLFEEAKKNKELLGEEGCEIGFVSILSSSVSIDTMNTSLPKKPLERAAYQALFIKRMLDDNPSITHLHLAGQSLGAAELPYVTVMLKELLKERNVTIEGMTLIQPGGHMDQGVRELIAGAPDVMSKPDELAFFFPSPMGKKAVETTGTRKGEKNFSTPVVDQYQVLPGLHAIDEQIEDLIKDKAYKGPPCDFPIRDGEKPGNWEVTRKERKKLRQLLNKRKDLINPLLKEYATYDARGATLTASVAFRMRKILGFITTSPPAWIREAVDSNVRIVVGKMDQYFPSSKFEERNDYVRIYSEKADEEWKYIDWAHMVTDVSHNDFARLVVAACARQDLF